MLAEHLGVDPMSVSRWERGATAPGPGTAKRLHWLLEGGRRNVASKVSLSERRRPDTDAGLYPAIAELVRIVGTDVSLRVLRERALLDRPPTATRFPVDPAVRLEEVDRALREQTQVIERSTIT